MRTKLIDDVAAAVNALGITVDTVIHQLVTKRGVEVDVRGRARARWENMAKSTLLDLDLLPTRHQHKIAAAATAAPEI